METIGNVGLTIIAATTVAFIAHFLKQPLLIAYILAGVLIGPNIGFGLIKDIEVIEKISHIGLIFLLFLIGLEIDIKKLRDAGKSMIISGFVQFPLSFIIGIGFFLLLGFSLSDKYDLFYLTACCALSSTAIVVKLLYSKFELDTLAGRITLGILVFQDIWAIVLLGIQPNLSNPQLIGLLFSFLKGFVLISFSMAVSKFILPKLFEKVAKVPELMLISALAWCFLICGIAHLSDLSIEMGALIAGIAISTFPYNLDVIAKVVNIRDFFITLFFVSLGMQIPNPFSDLSLLTTSLVCSAFVIISRFMAVFPVLYFLKNGIRISLVTSTNLTQISEFSIVIASLGLSYGHIKNETLALIIFIFVITSITSTYMIKYSDAIQKKISPLLKYLGFRPIRDRVFKEKDRVDNFQGDIAVLGFHRTASSLLHEFLHKEPHAEKLKDRLIVVDFNPEVYQSLKSLGVNVVYGDISHIDTLSHAGIENSKVVISTVPDTLLLGTDNLRLINHVRKIAPQAKIIVTAESIGRALKMYAEGADFVIVPRILSAQKIIDVLTLILEKRDDDLNTLIAREKNMLENRLEIIN